MPVNGREPRAQGKGAIPCHDWRSLSRQTGSAEPSSLQEVDIRAGPIPTENLNQKYRTNLQPGTQEARSDGGMHCFSDF